MTAPAISEGPRTLPVMPADQQIGLDPYMALIVGYRKSGLSLNHIIGCPLNCGYCVRHFWGNFQVKTPHLLCTDDQAVEMLTGHHAFRPHTTPIQLLNKATDPFLPGVRPHLFRVLRALDQRSYTNHVLVITRFTVTGTDMDLFRKTSCGVAYAHAAPDYNGHWGIREICDICPAAQQQRCADDHRRPTPADMDRVLAEFGYATRYLIEDGHVWTHGLGEQRRYAAPTNGPLPRSWSLTWKAAAHRTATTKPSSKSPSSPSPPGSPTPPAPISLSSIPAGPFPAVHGYLPA